jgi:hypothetical protein
MFPSAYRPHDHVMTLAGELRGDKILRRQASATFSPLALIALIADGERRDVVLKQLRIAGNPQLREPVPVFMLAEAHPPKRVPWPSNGPAYRFEPILDVVEQGTEVEAEFDAPEGTRFTLVLSGHLDFGAFLARLAETGSCRVRGAVIGISERGTATCGATTFGPRTEVSRPDPDGNVVMVMREEPMITFRPRWLAVSPECAPYYEVCDLRIGQDSFFVCATPIAATLLPPLPPTMEHLKKYMRLDAPLITPGIHLALTVRTRRGPELEAQAVGRSGLVISTGGRPCPPFRAAMHGITIEA